MSRTARATGAVAAAVALAVAGTGCTSTSTAARTPSHSVTHSAIQGAASAAPLASVPLTRADVATAGVVPTVRPADPVGDTRVRTLLTWCTQTAATEDAAATAYGPTLVVRGRHGADIVYSYARDLPGGTTTDAAAYARRLVSCWRGVLLPVLSAPLDVHIQHLTAGTTTAAVPLPALPYGTAAAAEGVVRWRPTPAAVERSAYDVAVLFGVHTEVTVVALGADGLTTGPQHLTADLLKLSQRIRGREHPAG